MKRKFLTKTARSQFQSISAFRDPFKLVPVNDISEIADKFTRNEILTSNEIRQIIGMKPSDDPKADKLVNSNISQPAENNSESSGNTENNMSSDQDDIVDELFNSLESEINRIVDGYISVNGEESEDEM